MTTPGITNIIIDLVVEYTEVSRSEIVSGDRGDSRVCHARHLAIYLLCEHTPLTLERIGEIMGGRNHSTISHSRNKIGDEIEIYPSVRGDVENINRRLRGMRILGVDPGTEESAYVVYMNDSVVDKDILENDAMRLMLETCFRAPNDRLAVEMIASYGMPVGKSTFETAVWIGRFIEAWGGPYELVYRQDVKMHICHDSRAKDSNIRQALIDRFPPTGGGATPQIGIKADPGPLYGFRRDLWSALAIAITSAETDEIKRLAT